MTMVIVVVTVMVIKTDACIIYIEFRFERCCIIITPLERARTTPHNYIVLRIILSEERPNKGDYNRNAYPASIVCSYICASSAIWSSELPIDRIPLLIK